MPGFEVVLCVNTLLLIDVIKQTKIRSINLLVILFFTYLHLASINYYLNSNRVIVGDDNAPNERVPAGPPALVIFK